MITKLELVNYLLNLGIEKGDLLNLKVSMRSIGQIENGAKDLIDAFLEVVGESGTIVSDSFVEAFPIPLSYKHKKLISNSNSISYAGVFANEMVKYPGSYRSPHPIQKFVAIGKDAKELAMKHDIGSMPYGLLYKLAQRGGKNIRIGDYEKVIGVGTTHIAITLKKFKQNIRKSGVIYIDHQGIKRLFELNWASGCPKGFNNLIPYFEKKGAILCKGLVGNAEALVTDMNKTLNLELELADKNPRFFMCDDPSCYKCRITWENSTGSIFRTLYYNIKSINIKNILAIIYFSLFKNYKP